MCAIIRVPFYENGMRESEIDRERRESEPERESEWTTVSRGRGRQRVRQAVEEDPRTNYAHKRKGQLQGYHHSNWRERKDITTYYFTRFPDHTMARDLWTHFKKWGDVREIFIPKHRNQGGRRYGIARFRGVSNEQELATTLDNLIIDGLKLYVNLPKYGRRKVGSEGHKVNLRTGPHGHTKEVRDNRHNQPQFTSEHRSYAEVTANNNTLSGGQRKQTRPIQTGQTQSHSTVQLQVDWGAKKWLTEAWVGRLKKHNDFERIEEEIPWELGVNVVPKYIGDDMVLLLRLSDSKAEKIRSGEAQSLVHLLERWNPSMKPAYRVVWAQCWGVPLQVWDIDNIRWIVTEVGELIDVDDDFEELRRVDRVRVLIRTPWKPLFHHTVATIIDGETHHIVIVEEGAANGGPRNQHARREMFTSEDIESDDTDSVFAGKTMSTSHVLLNLTHGSGDHGRADDDQLLHGTLPNIQNQVQRPPNIVQ